MYTIKDTGKTGTYLYNSVSNLGPYYIIVTYYYVLLKPNLLRSVSHFLRCKTYHAACMYLSVSRLTSYVSNIFETHVRRRKKDEGAVSHFLRRKT